ncbi:MAG: pantetheine-phosphate adenylyltransferase [Deltaproteobacteria bacterium]|nr:pantetheine-phosphate adenylyltransferase [Deltaproteobacteria bacterium]
MARLAIYPGTFDPITNGHLDLVRRGLRIFDHIIVAVAESSGKNPLFTVEERLEMIRIALEDTPNVTIETFSGLLVDYVRSRNAQVVLRGLRAVTDFEYEFQMAMMNRRMEPGIETVFLMTGLRWVFLSSRIIKEAAVHGGNIEGLVPEFVHQKLKEKFGLAP